MTKFFFSLSLIFSLAAFGECQTTLQIISPVARQVIQQNSGSASVTIVGSYPITITSVQAKADVVNGGTSVGWTTIYTGPGSVWSGSLTLVPGQYNISVQAFINMTGTNTVVVDKVGVGELFIVAGQSLVANFGQSANTPTDDRVSATDGNGNWQFAVDPQPIANGNAGSPIPALGSALAVEHNMPIGFLDVAVGGTSTVDWINTYYASNMVPAINAFGLTQFRAILWENGQQDGATGVTTSEYETNIATLQSNSRTLAGWTIPWGIANTSTELSLTVYPTIQAAQNFVVSNDTATFGGSDSDSISNADRFDGTHFNPTGQNLQAGMWAMGIETYFGW